MAEWLGRGLQNLVQRFESASDLRFCRADDFLSRLFCFLGVYVSTTHIPHKNINSQMAVALHKRILRAIAHLAKGRLCGYCVLLLGLAPCAMSYPHEFGQSPHFESA